MKTLKIHVKDVIRVLDFVTVIVRSFSAVKQKFSTFYQNACITIYVKLQGLRAPPVKTTKRGTKKGGKKG